MNRTALALASLLSLAAPAAFAGDREGGFRQGRHGWEGERGRERFEGRERHERFEQRERFEARGHWEQRVVSQWVPGRYETRVTPASCVFYGGYQQCTPGFPQQVWVEGGYVNTTQSVWVAWR